MRRVAGFLVLPWVAAAVGCAAPRPAPIGARRVPVLRTAVSEPVAASPAAAWTPAATSVSTPPRVAPPAGSRWAVDLRPYLGPVVDQGERATCNSFAATALLEFLVGRATGEIPGFSVNWNYLVGRSEAFGTPYLKRMYKGTDGLAGFLAVAAYERNGPVPESAWPYERRNRLQSGDPRCAGDGRQAPPEWCLSGVPPADLAPLPWRIRMELIPRERIADFLERERRPVVFNLSWYPGIEDAAGNVVRFPSAAEVASCAAGTGSCTGHAILLVGWDPASRVFLFRNSVGPDWGENGYGTLPERYVLEHCEACAYLPGLDGYGAEDRAFVESAVQGASAVLVDPEVGTASGGPARRPASSAP